MLMNKKYIIIILSITLFVVSVMGYIFYGTIQAEKKIIGHWVSNEDPEYIISFDSKGIITENYKDLDAIGKWYITRRLKGDYPEKYGFFLQTIVEDEKYVYIIDKLDDNNLELIYTDRGTSLSFTRIDVVK